MLHTRLDPFSYFTFPLAELILRISWSFFYNENIAWDLVTGTVVKYAGSDGLRGLFIIVAPRLSGD